MPSTDRYFGFEDLALLCEHVITALFSVGPQAAAAATSTSRPGIDTPPHSPKPSTSSQLNNATPSSSSSSSTKSQAPNLGEFIAYALYRTRLPVAITHQALLLLARLKARYPSARGTSTSPHRLFLSSLMLSSKISMDDTYSNQSWTLVGQNLFTLREVNQMERELFAFLGWNVVVRDEELAAWVVQNVIPWEGQRAMQKMAARTTLEDRKRRRDSSANHMPTPSASPSASRSPSPESVRHRRASDAALAMLHGGDHAAAIASSRTRRSRSRTPDHRASPYSAPCSRGSSCSSSATASPISSSTTPGSTGPSTPHDSNSPVHATSCAFNAATKHGQHYEPSMHSGQVVPPVAASNVHVASW
ncbi:hypothetical protein OIO90_001333 [Microbotryomycetes sp. JL221]|nr:hypothetical protein OIO90_001333 [Microbotryomycetes sp. JL221]